MKQTVFTIKDKPPIDSNGLLNKGLDELEREREQFERASTQYIKRLEKRIEDVTQAHAFIGRVVYIQEHHVRYDFCPDQTKPTIELCYITHVENGYAVGINLELDPRTKSLTFNNHFRVDPRDIREIPIEEEVRFGQMAQAVVTCLINNVPLVAFDTKPKKKPRTKTEEQL